MMGIKEAEYRMPMPWETVSPLTDIYQQMIGLRKANMPLTHGDFETIKAEDMLLHYARTWKNERIDIAMNLGQTSIKYDISGECLLKKRASCGLLMPGGYVITRSVRVMPIS